MPTDTRNTPEDRAARRVKDYTDLMWHAATYVIINAFLWLTVSEAAFWTTVGWGIGLAFHIAAYFIGREGPRNRRYQAFLAEEQAREEQDST
jgi:hypothetical protein